MTRIEYFNKIGELLEDACDELTIRDFATLLERVKETIEDMED